MGGHISIQRSQPNSQSLTPNILKTVSNDLAIARLGMALDTTANIRLRLMRFRAHRFERTKQPHK